MTSKQFKDGQEYDISDGKTTQVVKVVKNTLTYTTKSTKTTIKVHQKEEPKPSESVYKAQIKKIDSKLENRKPEEYEAYDISFVDQNGKVATDGKMREVRLSLEKFDAKDVDILHRKVALPLRQTIQARYLSLVSLVYRPWLYWLLP